MTNKTNKKDFDCVRNMREIRDRISAEITGKTHEELADWFNAHRYSDPVLQHFASRRKERGFGWRDQTANGHIEQK